MPRHLVSHISRASPMSNPFSTIGMSIARVATIFDTEFQDFTFNTYNFCWPILEYAVAIIVSCGPLLRPLLPKLKVLSFRFWWKATSKSDAARSMQHPNSFGFSQLSEPEIPLQSMPAPANVTSITGNASQYQHPAGPGNVRSHGSGLHVDLGEVSWPVETIQVERSWDVGSRHV